MNHGRMVVIDDVKYESYYDVCKAYGINFSEFLAYKKENAGINELELLGHFINNIAYCMKTRECNIFPKSNHLSLDFPSFLWYSVALQGGATL